LLVFVLEYKDLSRFFKK